MARARNIKPGFFKNEHLAATGLGGRVLFAGLWTLADHQGRLENRPERIKAEIFPYKCDHAVDVVKLLNLLQDKGFVLLYRVGVVDYIQILKFAEHQNPHKKEKAIGSRIPAPVPEKPVQAPEKPALAVLIPDSLIPDSGLPDSPIAADADVVTDEIVDLIRKAHPRGTEDAEDGRKAILKAIKREAKAHGSRKDAARFLYKRALFYRSKVAEWPPGDAKQYGKMCATWFNKESYNNPDESYERKTNGNSTNKSQARQSSNLDAIAEALRRKSARDAGEDISGDGHRIELVGDPGRGRLAADQVGEIGDRTRGVGTLQSTGTVAGKGEILTPYKRSIEDYDGRDG